MATATERDALPRAIRHRFPLLEHQVYLNSCSQGVLSDAVREAYAHYLRDWDEQGAPWEYWMERTESARSSFAGLVGARRRRDRRHGLGLGRRERDRERAARRRRPPTASSSPTSSSRPWGRSGTRRRTRGYTITHVPQGDAPVVPLEAFDAAIDEQTALVAVTQVCYRNGACIDLEGVIRLAHERGALVLVDAYQAVGIDADRRARARRRPARRRRAQVPARLRRPRLPLLPARAVRAAAPDRDRLVRR